MGNRLRRERIFARIAFFSLMAEMAPTRAGLLRWRMKLQAEQASVSEKNPVADWQVWLTVAAMLGVPALTLVGVLSGLIR